MRLTLPRPDDWHLHVRDGAWMASVLPHTARHFGRALLMPNLKPPITTVAHALAYRDAAQAIAGPDFTPYVCLYLTDRTSPADVIAARDAGVLAIKLYPAGATTHSDAGVTDLERLTPTLHAMEDAGLPLCLHGESTDASVDVFDRERVFLETVGGWLLTRFPALRLVVEHITTREAVAFVSSAPANVAATITPQHLLLNRNALFQGGVRPHHYCLPVLKREDHRQALVAAATSGNPKFFLGTDSAPHARPTKETACGCAGCFTAPHAIALYAQAFAQAGALGRLPDFASRFGAEFYRLPPPTGTITLIDTPMVVPAHYAFGPSEVVPLFAGEALPWQVEGETHAEAA